MSDRPLAILSLTLLGAFLAGCSREEKPSRAARPLPRARPRPRRAAASS